ncbi:glycosyltransferase [Shouchella sp. JSM 1781072]|uniref:glycosyltransferase n=1 Tax=Shouchella sp. JSM 1781072 TaxID=3344581 RepID=UPI0035BFC730
MKIVYIVSTLKGSGPINILYNITKYINRDKFSPVIITLSPEPKGSMINKFDELDIPVKKLNLSRVEGVLIGVKKIKSVLKEINPDVIHTHGHRADIMATSIKSGYPIVSTIHNYPYEDYIMKYGKIVGSLIAVANVRAFKKMAQPIACSRTIAKLMENHDVKAESIQNGVDQTLFSPQLMEEKIELRKKLGIPINKTVFISIGSLIKRKNPEMAINAFKKAEVNDQALLIVLGNGTLKQTCIDLVENSESIKILGHVDNVNQYLRASDYFVSTSLSEGLPNTVLESLATGVPVILSNIDQHKEILVYKKEAGVLFDVNNSEQLSHTYRDTVKSLNDNTKKDAALNIIENHLNAKCMTVNYERAYEKVVKEFG